jgi:cell division protein FtsB
MLVPRELLVRARRHLGAALGVCAVTYFGYHLTAGERGVLAWIRLDDALAVAKAELELRATERAAIEHDVGLMRPESLDLDMLDEQARKTLGYIREDEVVIYDDAPPGG